MVHNNETDVTCEHNRELLIRTHHVVGDSKENIFYHNV
jgi:hypothetical protein